MPPAVADEVPAKELFGRVKLPTAGKAQSLGFYAKGCLSGGVAIPVDGPTWQVLHLSRNRRWGNPEMIALVQRLSQEAREKDGWPGLLIGDISQPRGGPMLNGHASHQIGLDADIWLTPMPDYRLSYEQREKFPRNSVLRKDMVTVDPNKWTQAHARLIMRAASYPEVERVFVHPGIKKKLCDTWPNKAQLSKVRPIWGHHYHFHIRMKCPEGSVGCERQAAPPADSGCGKHLAEWLDRVRPRPVVQTDQKPQKVAKPKHLTLAALPNACAMVLNAKPVPNAMVAEYRSTTGPIGLSETAYAAPVQASAVAFSVIEDFADLVPDPAIVPVPGVRPMDQ